MPLLVLAFIVVPLVELWVIIEVGRLIGVWPTLALLLLDSALGAVLLRAQGRSAWRQFNAALAARRIPRREVFDGAMVIFGGALLLTPGFVTDAFGLLLLIPPTRAAVRRLLSRLLKRRLALGGSIAYWGLGRVRDRGGGAGGGAGDRPGGPTPPGAGGGTPYDVEGTAREVPDETSLPRPGER